MTVHQLTKRDARRLAVRAQLLTSERPADLFDVVRGLNAVQLDQTAYVAPNADLVAWSRLGSSYDPSELADALASQELIELRGFVRLPETLALYRAEMEAWPADGEPLEWQSYRRDWVQANEGCRLDILERLRRDGPLVMRELPDTCVRPWKSSGWTNNRNVSQLLEFMMQRGEVAIAGRDGRDRLWDLASRVYPDDPPVPLADAVRIRDEQRLRSMGLLRAKGPACPGEPLDAGAAGERAVVEGVRGEWRIDTEVLDQPFTGRTAILSPLDRLVFDRKRTEELFEFAYQLEMYKPAAQRQWGYWAMPVLDGDELVGKIDATADREGGVLIVDAVHEDGDWSARRRVRVDAEIDALGEWLGLEVSRP